MEKDQPVLLKEDNESVSLRCNFATDMRVSLLDRHLWAPKWPEKQGKLQHAGVNKLYNNVSAFQINYNYLTE
jgi:hypothetical protein